MSLSLSLIHICTTWTELTYPEDLASDLAQFDRLLSGDIKSYALDKRFVRKDGQVIYTYLAVRGVYKDDGGIDHLIALVEDITERKRIEAELREMSTTDFLTGLSNRRYFMARMAEELARLQRHDTQRAVVLMLDLDLSLIHI